MTDKREFFTTFKEIPPGTWKVTGIGGVELHAAGKSNVDVIYMVNGEEIRGTFHDVLYVPNLRVNLFSVGTATQSGVEVNFKGTEVLFRKDDMTIMVGERVGDSIYSLRVTPANCKQGEDVAAIASSTVPIQLLHQRFAHTNCRDLRRTIQLKAVKDVNLDPKQINTTDPCGGCLYGKMHRLPFPTVGRGRAEKLGDLIHGDLGMVSVLTSGGHRYYSLLKDDFSEFPDVKLLKKKNEAFTHAIEFFERIKTQTGRPVKVFRTDQGT